MYNSGMRNARLTPFPVALEDACGLEGAAEAYRRVIRGAGRRTVLKP